MKSGDFDVFTTVMEGLSETFTPEKVTSSEKIKLYFAAFADWDISQFKMACLSLISLRPDNIFPIFPTPAEIRRYLTAANKDEVLEQWLFVSGLISTYGHAMSLILPDPVTMSVIEAMGGWVQLTMTKAEDIVWAQKEFERYYPLMAKRDKHPAYMSGTYDAKHNMIDLNNGKQLSIEEAEKVMLEGKERPEILELVEPITDKKLKG